MTQSEFSALLAAGPILLDGATGSNLIRAGMPRGVCTEQWVAEHPAPLLALQRAYVQAGSQILYAPTFGANEYSLARFGLQSQMVELCHRLVALSREAADGRALVAGDMTTTGEPLEPKGSMSCDRLFSIYCRQAEALAEAGADLLVIETMLAVDETAVALEAARHVCALPVLCSLTVQADGSAYFGGNIVEAVETVQALGAAAVGINCSSGPEQLTGLLRQMQAVAQVPLLVKPNAGLPQITDSGEVCYPMGPAEFAAHMQTLLQQGARLVGGCCGTDPEFVAALKSKITSS